jgi:hypothetical protein
VKLLVVIVPLALFALSTLYYATRGTLERSQMVINLVMAAERTADEALYAMVTDSFDAKAEAAIKWHALMIALDTLSEHHPKAANRAHKLMESRGLITSLHRVSIQACLTTVEQADVSQQPLVAAIATRLAG